jgi:hypothetical protein
MQRLVGQEIGDKSSGGRGIDDYRCYIINRVGVLTNGLFNWKFRAKIITSRLLSVNCRGVPEGAEGVDGVVRRRGLILSVVVVGRVGGGGRSVV